MLVRNEENSEMIIRAPQIILIHFLNFLCFLDSIKSNIPPRVFVITESKLTAPSIRMTTLSQVPMDSGLDKIIETMTIDHRRDTICTIAEINLITFANFLCFIASLISRITHRIEPTIRMIPINIVKVEMVASVAVAVEVDIEGNELKS